MVNISLKYFTEVYEISWWTRQNRVLNQSNIP